MKVKFTYRGLGDGIYFSPIYPLMMATELTKMGFKVEVKRNLECYDYSGVPADNYFNKIYQDTIKDISALAGREIKFTDLDICYDLLDVKPQIYGTTTSAGCKYHCKFCPNKEMGFIERPKEKVLKELKWLSDNVSYFEFFDNNVLLSKTFLEVIDYIPKHMRWGALINIEKITPRLTMQLLKMYDCGCRNIYLGLETLNEEDLKFFGKPYLGKENPLDFLDLLKDIGFNVYAFVIRGLPNEKIGEFNKMFNILDSKGVYYGISRFYDGVNEVEATDYLPRIYLESKSQADQDITEKNLRKFLDLAINRLH